MSAPCRHDVTCPFCDEEWQEDCHNLAVECPGCRAPFATELQWDSLAQAGVLTLRAPLPRLVMSN